MFVIAATCVLALNLLLPVAVLSTARKPFDYFTVNPWLSRLPEYLFSSTHPWHERLAFLPDLALFWFSADSPFGVDWGFAVTVSDLLRFLLLALLFGAYFALVFHCRDRARDWGWRSRLGRGSGASGALASALGVSTGGCTVMGCGAPVLPVVGLAFVGLSSGAIALLAEVSRIATLVVFVAVATGVIYLGHVAGGATQRGH